MNRQQRSKEFFHHNEEEDALLYLFGAVPSYVLRLVTPHMTLPQLLVYLQLWGAAKNYTAEVQISFGRLATLTGYSTKTVQVAIKDLIHVCLLRIIKRAHRGSLTPHRYQLLVEADNAAWTVTAKREAKERVEAEVTAI